MRKTIMYSLLLFAAMDSILAAGNMHPAYDLIRLRPDIDGGEWKPRGVGGMEWLPDGRMIICTWGGNNNKGEDCQRGRLWLVEGAMDATGPEDVTVTEVEILDGQYQSEQACAGEGLLREPLGIRYVNGELYVLEKPRLTRIIDATGTGSYEQVRLETFSTNWTYGDGSWHHFSYGLAYRDGYFYFNTGHHPPREEGPDRGACLRVSLQDGSYSAFAGGLRNANGIGVGPADEIFFVDSQGNWMPSCKLANVRQGRFYGVHKPDGHFENEPESPPVLWFVHKEIGQSTAEPLWLKTGAFAGHMLVADQKWGGLTRCFLERIDGEFQGCGFQFAKPGFPGQEGSFEAGTNRLLQGADGSFSQIFVGGVGGAVAGLGGPGVTWNWNGTWYGFEKIVENGNTAFEMYAVRSLADGFEIEFTQPASDAAANTSNYTVLRGGFDPIFDYGAGNMLNKRAVTVLGAAVSYRVYGRAVEEMATALLRSESGVIGTVEAGYTYAAMSGGDFEWRVAAGNCYLVDRGPTLEVATLDDGRRASLEIPDQRARYDRFAGDTLARLQAGQRPVATLGDCYRAMRVVDEVYRMAAETA